MVAAAASCSLATTKSVREVPRSCAARSMRRFCSGVTLASKRSGLLGAFIVLTALIVCDIITSDLQLQMYGNLPGMSMILLRPFDSARYDLGFLTLFRLLLFQWFVFQKHVHN